MLRCPTGGGTERFAALNAALSVDPMLVDVECRRHAATTVLHVSLAATGDGAIAMSYPRIALRLAPDSLLRGSCLHHGGDDAAERFVNSVIGRRTRRGRDAAAAIAAAQGAHDFHIERIEHVRVRPARAVAVHDAQLGARLARLDLHVALAGAAPQPSSRACSSPTARGTSTPTSAIDHRAVGTRSLQDYRGVAGGRGRAVFNGKAIVARGAQKSNARQSSRNLLLTPGAEIDTKPELEIYADDVQCSHGATTGQLDPAPSSTCVRAALGERGAQRADPRLCGVPCCPESTSRRSRPLVHDRTRRAASTRLLEHAGMSAACTRPRPQPAHRSTSRLRRDFPILARTINGKPLVYLDNAASSQHPQRRDRRHVPLLRDARTPTCIAACTR